MKETDKEHTGITFVVVYPPPPSTRVIYVQVDVDFGVAGSIEAAVGHSPTASPTMASWPLVGGPQCLLGHFSHYTILAIIVGRMSYTGLCEHIL